MERAHGIDVSHHVRVTDWNKLYAQDLAIFGAKATNGKAVDDAFAAHAAGARGGRFDVVLYYHFPTPLSSAVAQADHLFETVSRGGGLRPNEMMALDVERDGRGTPRTDDDWSPDIRFVDEFTREFVRLVGDRRFLIYTSKRVWNQYLHSPMWPGAVATDLWSPRYKSGTQEPELPIDHSFIPVWPRWKFWQDSEEYSCPGVDGPCDHDVFNGTREDLRRYVLPMGSVVR